MKHDLETFSRDIVTLIKKSGDSGGSGDKSKKSLRDSDFFVPTRETVVSPVASDWGHEMSASGDRKSQHLQAVVSSVPSVPTATTSFAEGRTAAPIEGEPPEWYAILAELKERENPDWMSPDKWEMLLADAEHFLIRWSRTAAAMGWTALDLFGVHPTRPAARFDVMGLLLLLQGSEVIALSTESASFRRPSGADLRFSRPATGGVLLSEATCNDY